MKDEEKTRDQLLQEIAVLREQNDRFQAQKSSSQNDELFKAITTVAEDSIFIKDADFRYTFVNPAMEKLLGLSAEQLIGKTPSEIFGEENARIIREVDAPVLKGRVINAVRDLELPDGVHYFHTIQVPLYGDNGSVTAICGFVRDVTDRKRAEQALQQSEELFRLASLVSSDIIYEWNLADDKIKWHGYAPEMLGYQPDEIPKTVTDWTGMIHPEDYEKIRGSIEDHRTSGESSHYEYRIRAADGSWRYWVSRSMPVIDEYGRVIRRIGSCVDVSERKQAEDDLIRAYKKLQELDEIKNDFLSNISHELRTPLVGIKGYVDLLLRKIPDEQTALEWLTIAADNVNRLESIINDLLDISMLAAKTISFNFENTDIIRQVEMAIEAVKPRQQEKQLNIQFIHDDDLPPIKADINRIQSVFLNLLDNAIKFTDDGRKITVRATKKDPDNLLLEFIDEGYGIPQEFLDKIFTRFFQVDSSVTRKQGGSGIGLSLAREIVTAHGGVIEVESEPGRGSRFTVTMPFAAQSGSQITTTPGTPVKHPTADDQRLNVLLVDDDLGVVDFFGNLVGDQCQLRFAFDGRQALETIRSSKPDLVFLDISMPEMSGIEVCTCIKDDPALKHLPVYMLTARTAESDKFASVAAGADGFIEKPFPIDAILDILKSHRKFPSPG